ncbi:TIGR03016 family PEP-CTERM system-associated outer membrane protein [Sedimenticola selenatireducens]|uniref:TIGR03016 family PEP-CTERM system-associated outer membrane protein n=1 Tax=Sedimenticola selenatireducens TaxID=191960 RepID=UPI0016425168|nr:TIGR03016 family PEP-CTERM system-associated outer membrane protein [Sedimenticola selenatireducens]
MSGLTLFSFSALAAEWNSTASINASAVYTDNVNLVTTGKESDLTPTLTPSISLHGKGARATVDLTAAAEFNGQGGGNDSVNPRLQADAKAELFERVAFIDLNATATQNAIEPLAVSGSGNLNNRGNKTTTYSYKISPYLKSRFKGLADTELRYTYNDLNHSEGSVGDTSSETVNLSITSGPDFKLFSWGVNASNKVTDNEQGQVSELSSADFDLGYQLNRRWRVTGSIGTESNDFNSVSTNRDGSRWDIGAVWTPNPRTVFDFGFGDRFFGSTKRFSFTHTGRRSTLTASYSQDLTDSTTLLSDQVVFQVVDQFGQPIINPVTGDPFLLAQNISTIGNSTFVNDQLTVGYSLKGRRTTLSLNGNISEQTYQDSSREVSQYGLGASINRQLSGKISGDLGLNWSESEEKGTASTQSDTWRLSAGINQELGPKTNLRLNYSFTDRSSNQSGQSYEENRLSLTLNHTL